MKRAICVVAAVAIFAIAALVVPVPAAARQCVQCPVIEDPTCPPCYELVPGTCSHCAYCKRIHGCHT